MVKDDQVIAITARTWASLFQDDMTVRVPLVVRAPLPRLERRRAKRE